MQKDIHFYLTYALARKAGINAERALRIAWANQYTDDLTKADLYGIQTQSAIVGNWKDRQIQLSVLVPFHFVPGNQSSKPWAVTRNNVFANRLTDIAKSSKCPFQFGIALHALQDTFSHEGFTGWDEDFNACYKWYYIESTIPNVGHAEMRATPDIVNITWTDPRTGEIINNQKKTLEAAEVTAYYLANPTVVFPKEYLIEIFKLNSYDERKRQLAQLAGKECIRYSEIKKMYANSNWKNSFIQAAKRHIAIAMQLFAELPSR